MKHIVLVTCAGFLLLCQPVTSLAQWAWQTPVPQGNTLLSVLFLDTVYGWAVGEDGTIIHTTSGGTKWYEQMYGETDNILGISMFSGDIGWAVGDNGTIVYTTDGGDDWLDQTSGISSGLNDVVFLDSLNGWAAGDGEIILHTSNGGVHWSMQHQSVTGSINGLAFLSATEGWAVGSNGRILHTSDGGANWTGRTVGTGTTIFSDVFFLDTANGFVVGAQGALYQTNDHGLTWTPLSTGDTINLNKIIMQNSLVGWIVGDAGNVYRTINGGSSRSRSTLGDGSNFNGITRFGGRLWLAGDLGRLEKTTNGGASWYPLDNGTRLSVNWIDMPTNNVGVGVGQTGLIMRTTNAGVSWALQTSPVPSSSCYGVKFTDALHGWAVGDAGLILRTTDGATWNTQTSGVTHSLFGISFADPLTGWIVGGEFTNYTGIILNSVDSGNTWHTQYTGVPKVLFGISFPTSAEGWAVGANGYITHSTDGGATWTQQTSGTVQNLFWCAFSDINNGWAVGDSGAILHTTNGGVNWAAQNSGVTVSLYSVTTLAPSEAVAVGDLGTVLATADGGANWLSQYSRTNNSLFGVTTNGSGLVIAAGDYGTLLGNTFEPQGGNFFGYQIDGGWNILSAPLSTTDMSLPNLYPSAISSAFSFRVASGYSVNDTLHPGIGYWIRFSTAQTLWMSGFKIPADTIALDQGWNLIGNLSDTIPVASMVTEPPGIVSSSIFGYDNGYFTTGILAPGKGYWMRTDLPGTLIVTTSAATPGNVPFSPSALLSASPSLNSLTFSNGDGGRETLYFSDTMDAAVLRTSVLPPIPPADAFDVRFHSGTQAAELNAQSSTSLINIQSGSSPLTVSWTIRDYTKYSYSLVDPATNTEIIRLTSARGFQKITGANISSLVLVAQAVGGSGQVPKSFALFQNTPNPFNPSTRISFAIPQRSNLTITVYNILGQRIASLFDGVIDEGVHSVDWQPDMPTGVYFYRMEASTVTGKGMHFTDTKKMLYLK